VFLFRDALHVVLPVFASIVRRLRWKTKSVGQLRTAGGQRSSSHERPGAWVASCSFILWRQGGIQIDVNATEQRL
ncbi:hypothetical protein, partial [Thauera sp. AutoDN2]|uniref:hypothetical protein n=1 Tax=Thauera sp. AutoDN2 TaxID=3416051 RepID=UPI003F4B3BC4